MGPDLDMQLAWSGRSKYAKEKVGPVLLKHDSEKSLAGEGEDSNLVIEGNNLEVMVALLASSSHAKLREGVDLMIWDPPYNTGAKPVKNKGAISVGRGSRFRYNDDYSLSAKEIAKLKERGNDDWDVVSETDPSKHSKWLSFMEARIRAASKLLKASGVMAIHIDDVEMFRLGVLLDEIFGEQNRLAIINWQKQHSPKNDSGHVATTTEYILVYAKNRGLAETAMLARSSDLDSAYRSRDGDLRVWNGVDPVAKTPDPANRYAIQSPFTGELHYPGSGAWRHPKRNMKTWLEEWGSKYQERDIGDGRGKALLLAGVKVLAKSFPDDLDTNHIVRIHGIELDINFEAARSQAVSRLSKPWPKLYFRQSKDRVPGHGRPRIKSYLEEVQQGVVPTTYWSDEAYEEPLELGSVSWPYTNSDHTQAARLELDRIVGRNHGFETVKPLKLIKKLVQLWCPMDGVVLDAFGGSGTTAHAVLALNAEVDEACRRFVVIERGEGSDRYADSLTAERIRRVISGKWIAGPQSTLGGGFRFLSSLDERGVPYKVTKKHVLAWARDQLVDAILQSQDTTGVKTFDVSPVRTDIVGSTKKGNALALVWGSDSAITDKRLDKILEDADNMGLKCPVYIFAKANRARFAEEDYKFMKIPDRILASLGVTAEED